MRSAVASPTMIGRGRELRQLHEVLAEVRQGVPRAVVVAGEAGIGKTRLLAEFQASAAEHGRILFGQCVDLGSAGVPYASIVAVLRSLVQQAGPDAVLAAAGPGREALTLLLPELAERPADPVAAGADSLHEMVAVTLETFAREHPIIVVVEDLHWADSASLTVLQFLLNAVTSGSIMLVLSYRSDDVGRGHPLRTLLSNAERARVVTRIELRRLSLDEVKAQAQQILGSAPDPDTLASVFERSEGVPFFVEELVDRDSGDLPNTLRDLLLARYDRLSDEARHLLRMLSAGGMTVPHRLLARVWERPSLGRVSVDLDLPAREAVTANVLVAGHDSYTFRHALVREAIDADLLPGERTRFHTGFAEAMEADGDCSSVEVAQHWFAAGNPAKAFPSALAAMNDAKRAYAYATAAQLGERALALWDQVPGAEEVAGLSRVELLAKTASALRNAGNGARALATVNVALEEYEAEGTTLARLLRDKANYLSQVGQPGSIALLERALGMVPPGADERLRLTLLNTLAGRLMLEGHLERAIGFAEAAVSLASTLDSPAQASIAANLAGLCKAHLGRVPEGLDQLDSARPLAQGDPGAMLRYRVNASDLRFHVGQYERALALAEKGMVRAREFGVERVSGVILAANAVEPMIALGQWDRAEAMIERMLALAPPDAFRWYLQRAKLSLLLWRGNVEAAYAQFRAWRPGMTGGALAEKQNLLGNAKVFAEVLFERGDLDEAWDQVAIVLQPDHRPIAAYDLPLLAVAARVLASRRSSGAVPLAEGDAAESRLRELLEPLRFWPTWPMWSGLFEAELAVEGEVERWESVVRGPASGPAYLRPYALLRLGQAQVDAGDRLGGRESLRAAVEAATVLGSQLIIDRAVSFSERAGLVVGDEAPARTSDSLQLTSRERQVLRLLEKGLSNRQIGEELFISSKTASVHVSAILRKLGVATRTEAAVSAARVLGE